MDLVKKRQRNIPTQSKASDTTGGDANRSAAFSNSASAMEREPDATDACVIDSDYGDVEDISSKLKTNVSAEQLEKLSMHDLSNLNWEKINTLLHSHYGYGIELLKPVDSIHSGMLQRFKENCEDDDVLFLVET